MNDQHGLFDDDSPVEEIDDSPVEEIRDGYEIEPLSHRDGPDTEREAAESIKPKVGTLRRKVLDLAIAGGSAGVTGWEATVALDMKKWETSVRPRLTELCDEKHGAPLFKSKLRRPNRNGNREVAYVHRSHMAAHMEDAE